MKSEKLYDLQNDIQEQHNVIDKYLKIAKLWKIADDYRADLGDVLSGMEGPGRRNPGYR